MRFTCLINYKMFFSFEFNTNYLNNHTKFTLKYVKNTIQSFNKDLSGPFPSQVQNVFLLREKIKQERTGDSAYVCRMY